MPGDLVFIDADISPCLKERINFFISLLDIDTIIKKRQKVPDALGMGMMPHPNNGDMLEAGVAAEVGRFAKSRRLL